MKSIDHEHSELAAALAAIAATHAGVLNPRDVVNEARDPGHVLHRRFDWNDTTAAEAYRVEQASALIRRVKLTIIRTDRVDRSIRLTTTRGYQSRPSMRSASGGYESIDALLGDEHKRAELLAQVLRELDAYRRRYADLSELESVWTAVDEAIDTNAPSRPDDEARPGAAG